MSKVITPYQNTEQVRSGVSSGTNFFKEQLALAITAAATKGVSVLCDGEDITLYSPQNSSEVLRYVNSDGRVTHKATPKSNKKLEENLFQ